MHVEHVVRYVISLRLILWQLRFVFYPMLVAIVLSLNLVKGRRKSNKQMTEYEGT